jgi:chorismate synthase
MPAGLEITEDQSALDLRRRQGGYGRSRRQQIEQDHAEILGGVRHGRTLGSPIAMMIANRVWEDWSEVMQVGPYDGEP